MRQQTITISANPADVQQEAERIANILRQQGNTVTATGVYTIQTGHKRGLPAVDLTIEEPAAPEQSESIVEAVSAGEQVAPADLTTPAEAAIVWGKDHAVAPALASENDPESWRETSLEPAPEPPVKNKGGRPKGSKTKPKAVAA